MCTRLKPKKIWDICLDDEDNQSICGRGLYGGIFHKVVAILRMIHSVLQRVKKWKIVNGIILVFEIKYI